MKNTKYNIFKKYYNSLTDYQKKILSLIVKNNCVLICSLNHKYKLKYIDGFTKVIRKDTALRILRPELKYVWKNVLVY